METSSRSARTDHGRAVALAAVIVTAAAFGWAFVRAPSPQREGWFTGTGAPTAAVTPRTTPPALRPSEPRRVTVVVPTYRLRRRTLLAAGWLQEEQVDERSLPDGPLVTSLASVVGCRATTDLPEGRPVPRAGVTTAPPPLSLGRGPRPGCEAFALRVASFSDDRGDPCAGDDVFLLAHYTREQGSTIVLSSAPVLGRGCILALAPAAGPDARGGEMTLEVPARSVPALRRAQREAELKPYLLPDDCAHGSLPCEATCPCTSALYVFEE